MGGCNACCRGGKVAIHDHYDIERVAVGSGVRSKVFKAVHKTTGEVVAVKRIEKALTLSRTLWDDELSMMQTCSDNTNIVNLLHVYETDTYVYLVTKYAFGGELFDRIIKEGAYDETKARQHLHDILLALQSLHANGIVHRNLKPENLLLTTTKSDARLQLSDFSVACLLQQEKFLTTVAGTWAYAAPEVLQSDQEYDEKCDIWSAGIILCVLLTGFHPFDQDGRQTTKRMMENILKGELNLDSRPWKSISSEAKDMIRLLLTKDPTQRPNAAEALQHVWISQTHESPVALTTSLDSYRRRMQRKFRSSVVAAVAASKLRKSIVSDSNCIELEMPEGEQSTSTPLP